MGSRHSLRLLRCARMGSRLHLKVAIALTRMGGAIFLQSGDCFAQSVGENGGEPTPLASGDCFDQNGEQSFSTSGTYFAPNGERPSSKTVGSSSSSGVNLSGQRARQNTAYFHHLMRSSMLCWRHNEVQTRTELRCGFLLGVCCLFRPQLFRLVIVLWH